MAGKCLFACMFRHLFLATFLLFSSVLPAQDCPDLLIIVEDINSFLNSYPNCTELSNDIIIRGDAIDDLVGLENITQINGNLTIEDTDISSFQGLNNLHTITGEFKIDNNDNLINFAGLNSLTTIDGLVVWWNDVLQDFSGLENITTVGALNPTASLGLNIYSNSALNSFTGLHNLITILAEKPGGGLSVSSNDVLNNFYGLNSLQHIESKLRINNNDGLTSMNGLEGLHSVGSIELRGNIPSLNPLNISNPVSEVLIISTSLISLAGIEGVPNITSKLTITSNHNLQDISALLQTDLLGVQVQISSNSSLTNCSIAPICEIISNNSSLSIFNNNGACTDYIDAALACCSANASWCHQSNECPGAVLFDQTDVSQFLQAFPNCTMIQGSLTIRESVVDLNPLINIQFIGGELYIWNTPLTSLGGLDNLHTIYGGLGIQDNANLYDFDGLHNVTEVGDLYASDNAANDFDGLASLTTIHGIIDLEYSDITSFGGLENVTSIGEIRMQNAMNIVDFSGLDSVHTIGRIDIYGNPVMDSFDGLSNLTTCESISVYNTPLQSVAGMNLTSDLNLLYLQFTELSSLDDLLDSVPAINSWFTIQGNPFLSDISGLEQVDLSGPVIRISDNYSLDVCDYTSVCNRLSTSTNSVTISNNSGNCVDVFSILNQCIPGAAIFIDNVNSWNTPSAWLSGAVPSSSSDVIILSGTNCFISPNSSAECNTLFVQPNASLECIEGCELIVFGN